MTSYKQQNPRGGTLTTRLPFYYGWTNLLLAAAAMVATLPGRSVGIGLITEPLLQDLSIGRVAFGKMNFMATLIGSSFAVLCGLAVDRFGARLVVTLVLAALSSVVLAFSQATAVPLLVILLMLVRGFGQSALSAVSLTLVGKWFVRRLSIAMAVFTALVSVGFAAAIFFAQNAVQEYGWRSTWAVIGWSLFILTVLAWIIVRRNPESIGLEVDPAPDSKTKSHSETRSSESSVGFTLKGALTTPAFWLFALGSALYSLVIAGVLLFNQSILAQLGFDETVFRNAMIVFMLTGLVSNLLAGWLAQRWSIARIMSGAMVLVAVYLVTFPHLMTQLHVLLHAGILSFAGGVVAVVFFTSFGKAFGRPHLGKIQGAAQIATVVASACGPWLLVEVFERTGSYAPAFYGLAPAVLVFAVAAWFVQVPKPEDAGIGPVLIETQPSEA